MKIIPDRGVQASAAAIGVVAIAVVLYPGWITGLIFAAWAAATVYAVTVAARR